MTPEDAQLIFDVCLALPIMCYGIGVGIGWIIKILRSAIE